MAACLSSTGVDVKPSLVALAAAAVCLPLATPPARAQAPVVPPSAEAPARQVVTRADQLPRRTVTLDRLPSAYLKAPLADLKPMGAAVEAKLQRDLATYDIQDSATLREIYGALATLAQLRGDWAAVPGWTAKARALQDKAGPRLTSGVLTDLLARQQLEGRDAAWLGEQSRAQYGAMPWGDVQDIVKGSKGGLETYNPELVVGAFQGQLDTMARNGDNVVPESVAMAIIGARLQMHLLPPNRAVLVAALQSVIDRHDVVATKPDLWTPRTFAIPADAKASPVTVAVWDSGVDLALFPASPARGLAFDADGRPATDLLRPLGEAQARWPQLRTLVKGAMDQRAALDTPEARQLRQTLAGLKADEAKPFLEDMSLVGLYTHGTHVAGIVVDGNPFARVFAGTMLWDHRMEPPLPTEARSRATAVAYRQMVQAFKDADVRVVNMSWRYGPGAYEAMLGFHNAGGTPEQRKQEALRLFAIERDALRDAIAGAPEIFFVAGSGNEDNSADFEEYIPAGLVLPNLITVGAVDRAGSETSFSTFGQTVVVHANGFEVESLLPGGDRVKFSGTSMASPQVANLAAKLLALDPKLTPVQLKDLILRGAERLPDAAGQPGRVNLVNPRRSAVLAGLKP
jgi:hypothetical protein